MELRRLRYFLAVAEELHFGRAAERLGMAQPPLTQQIQKLERELGCQLLARGRKTQLTEAGAVLLVQARQLLDQHDRAAEDTRRAARGETGRLAIGVPPSVMLTALPAAIRQYRERYPDVAFTLNELSTSAIEEAVRAGRIDLGFLREAQPGPPLVAERAYREPLVAVVPAAHPLARRRFVRLAALAGEPFVFFARSLGPAFHDHLLGCCARSGFSPRIAQQATQWQTIVALVEAGMGVTVAPAGVRKFGWPGVVSVPVPEEATDIFTCRPAGDPAPAVARFLALARPALSRVRG